MCTVQNQKTAYPEKIGLSIVLPCLNEGPSLEASIRKAQAAIELSKMHGEVIVADNGSIDRSCRVAERLECLLVHQMKRGYGHALREGIQHAQGRLIIIGDADDTYDFREIVPFLNQLENGADLLIGTRLGGRIAPGAMCMLHRRLGTPILTRLVNYFFGTTITDINCGLRAFSRETYMKLTMDSGGMEFSSEMIIKAGGAGMRIHEFPCSLRPHIAGRCSHLKTWRDGWRHLRLILLSAGQNIRTLMKTGIIHEP